MRTGAPQAPGWETGAPGTQRWGAESAARDSRSGHGSSGTWEQAPGGPCPPPNPLPADLPRAQPCSAPAAGFTRKSWPRHQEGGVRPVSDGHRGPTRGWVSKRRRRGGRSCPPARSRGLSKKPYSGAPRLREEIRSKGGKLFPPFFSSVSFKPDDKYLGM